MTRTVAKYPSVEAIAEEMEEVVMQAMEDGVVSPDEQMAIAWCARRVRLASHRQAIRRRLAVRMINGGDLDREIMQDVHDYQELRRQEKAATQWRPLAA